MERQLKLHQRLNYMLIGLLIGAMGGGVAWAARYTAASQPTYMGIATVNGAAVTDTAALCYPAAPRGAYRVLFQNSGSSPFCLAEDAGATCGGAGATDGYTLVAGATVAVTVGQLPVYCVAPSGTSSTLDVLRGDV